MSDSNGRYVGIVTARTVAVTVADGEHDNATVASVTESPTPVTAGQSLEECLDALESTSASAVPVLDIQGENVIGWLTAQRILTALRDRNADHRNPRSSRFRARRPADPGVD